MKTVNISFEELLAETGATLKTGIKFVNWNGDNKHYWHVAFNQYNATLPSNLPAYYTYLIANNFDPIKFVPQMIEDNRIANSSSIDQYHFDTFKLNDFLLKKCASLEIKLIDTIIDTVNISDTGYITSLVDQSGHVHDADFFIDSTGVKRVLMNKLGSKWIDYKQYLPMNHAIAFPTPSENDINVFTASTAMNAGWKWKIPTQTRYGNGYVFCDDFITVDQAVDEIEKDLGHTVEIARDIRFGAGRLDSIMKKNCVAVGLSAMFVEPLEASSIGSSIQQAFLLSHLLGSVVEGDTNIECLYNKKVNIMFDNIVDFIQIHYLTKRDDTDFWKNLEFKLTDFNQNTLPLFKKKMPCAQFFDDNLNLFKHDNWIKVMYGLDLFDKEAINRQWVTQPAEHRAIIKSNFDNFLETQEKATTVSQRDYINGILTIYENITRIH
jgi:tryptophan halogenase